YYFTVLLPHPALHSFPTRRSSDLPHKHSVGRPLTLFETRTCSEQAVERTRCASGRTGLAGKSSAGTEYRGPGQRRIDRDVPHRRSEEHTSELQSRVDLVCRLLLEK